MPDSSPTTKIPTMPAATTDLLIGTRCLSARRVSCVAAGMSCAAVSVSCVVAGISCAAVSVVSGVSVAMSIYSFPCGGVGCPRRARAWTIPELPASRSSSRSLSSRRGPVAAHLAREHRHAAENGQRTVPVSGMMLSVECAPSWRTDPEGAGRECECGDEIHVLLPPREASRVPLRKFDPRRCAAEIRRGYLPHLRKNGAPTELNPGEPCGSSPPSASDRSRASARSWTSLPGTSPTPGIGTELGSRWITTTPRRARGRIEGGTGVSTGTETLHRLKAVEGFRSRSVRHGSQILARSVAPTQSGTGHRLRASCSPLPLPLPLQFIIAMMAHAINERMARQLDYLQEDVRVLREVFAEKTGRKRIPFTDEPRRRRGQGPDPGRARAPLSARATQHNERARLSSTSTSA